MKGKLHVENLKATATDVLLPMGLTVDEVTVEIGPSIAQLKPPSVEMTRPANFEVRVGAASIAAFLEAKNPGNLKDFDVSVSDGFVTVETTAKVIVEIRVAAVCTLRIVDQNALFVDLDSVSVKAPMAKGLVEQQLAKINPILDLRELGLTATLESVTAENGFVTVKGLAELPQSG